MWSGENSFLDGVHHVWGAKCDCLFPVGFAEDEIDHMWGLRFRSETVAQWSRNTTSRDFIYCAIKDKSDEFLAGTMKNKSESWLASEVTNKVTLRFGVEACVGIMF